MFMKKRHITLVSCLLGLALLLLAGCGNQNNTPAPDNNNTTNPQNMTTPAPENDAQNGTDNNNNGNNSNTNDVNQNSAADDLVDNADMSQRAEKVAKAIVDDVKDVEDAHVVLSEHAAYAAVKIKAADQTGQAESVKEEVIKSAKAADKDLTDVYVSESPDIFTRLEEIGDDIGEGRPISGFVEELENLFVRVTPTK